MRLSPRDFDTRRARLDKVDAERVIIGVVVSVILICATSMKELAPSLYEKLRSLEWMPQWCPKRCHNSATSSSGGGGATSSSDA